MPALRWRDSRLSMVIFMRYDDSVLVKAHVVVLLVVMWGYVGRNG